METLRRSSLRSDEVLAFRPGTRVAASPGLAPGLGFALVDAHVHFYPCYDRDRFLDAALRNFRRGAAELRLPESTPGVLLLSEARGERWFERLREETEGVRRGAWEFVPCLADRDSIVARRRADPRDRIFLVAGRQIATREGVEVLALAT